MRILIIQTAFAGDALLASAFVQDISERYPVAAIDILLRRGNEALFVGNPAISRIWTWQKEKAKYRNLVRLARQLRDERFDRVYNLQRYAATGFLTWRTGASFRAGFAQNPFARCYHHAVSHQIPWPSAEGQFLHEVQRNRQLLETGPAPLRRPVLVLGADDHEQAEKLLDGRPTIVIAPASRWFTKQWPEEHWASLLALLPAELRVVIVGGSDDRALGDRLAKAHPDAVNACGKLDFRASAAVMQRAWQVFANDSLPVHLASAVNAPCTVVFCSTDPILGFGPLSDDAETVQSPTPCCSPGLHGAKSCQAGHFRCAMEIQPEKLVASRRAIWQAALALRHGEAISLIHGDTRRLAVLATNDKGVQEHGLSKGEAQLWFQNDAMVKTHAADGGPAWQRVLAVHRESPARLSMPLKPSIAPMLQRASLDVARNSQWQTLIRCAGAPVAVRPAKPGETLPSTTLELSVLPSPAALHLVWDGSAWQVQEDAPTRDAFQPWVAAAAT